jgi:son of sevenless-like protein
MVPLLHGLTLLQGAAQFKRTTHYQPSTACIISCVRSVLSATDCLPREAPLLQQFSVLSQERKRILSVLASLVAQAKRASEAVDGEVDVQTMLSLGAQVFSHVRQFLALAVQCGVELPERRQDTALSNGTRDIEGQHRNQDDSEHIPLPRSTSALSNRGITSRNDETTLENPPMKWSTDEPGLLRSFLPSIFSERCKEPHHTLRQQNHGHPHKGEKSSISSLGSSSSLSSRESAGIPTIPPFPSGPSSTSQVIEALRSTHDQYLSTIAAFIGHAHSHSRSSHASSTGHMYDLIREIVEMVCKLLTIVESVIRHPSVPPHKLGTLKSAKEGLYNVTSALAESVRLLTVSLPPTMSEEDEKQLLLRSATSALKAGADCVAAVKMCLNRSTGESSFTFDLPKVGEPTAELFTSYKFTPSRNFNDPGSPTPLYHLNITDDEEDLTIQAQTSSPTINQTRNTPPVLPQIGTDPSSWNSHHTRAFSCSTSDAGLASPTFSPSDDGTTWEGGERQYLSDGSLEEKIVNGHIPSVPLQPIAEYVGQDRESWMLQCDYAPDDVAYNSDGHLVGATVEVLVAKMTPHDSIVDAAFSAIFFLTFRLFSSPQELVRALVSRYNLLPPPNLYPEELQIWQQRKGIPVRLRVSNFIKLWLEMYWRPSVDDVVLPSLKTFTQEALAVMFPGPSQRILDLINLRENTSSNVAVSPKGDRIRDPGMSINPPVLVHNSEIPRPTMTKTLLAALRNNNFTLISITDFDSLELARQLTVMECNLYCAIQPEEILETGQEGIKPPVNVRAMSTLSTMITGWVAESILNEHDTKKRTLLVKFFIKVADVSLTFFNHNRVNQSV